MNNQFRKFAVIIAGILFATLSLTTANAIVVHDESASGDLSNIPTGPYLSLGQGINSFVGSVAFTDTGTDMDAFRFVVPVGLQLTSATMTYSAAEVSDLVGSLWFLYRYESAVVRPSISFGRIRACSDLESSWCTSSPSPENWFTYALPIGSGSYILWNDSLGRADAGGVIPYRLDLYVSSTIVDEPATLALLGLGLAGLGLSRRRKAA